MKSIALILVLAVSTTVYAQQTPYSVNDNFLKKSKTQKIVAWSLLGGGLILGTIGLGNALKQVAPVVLFGPWGYSAVDEKKLNNGAALMIIGSVAIISSIPLFIVASRNKYKARYLTFTNQTAPTLVQKNIINVPVPSLTLKLGL